MANSGHRLVDVSIWERELLSLTLLTWNINLVLILKENNRVTNEAELALYSRAVLDGQIDKDFSKLWER